MDLTRAQRERILAAVRWGDYCGLVDGDIAQDNLHLLQAAASVLACPECEGDGLVHHGPSDTYLTCCSCAAAQEVIRGK